MPKIISFRNYKGDVAKTTSTYHVGCLLGVHPLLPADRVASRTAAIHAEEIDDQNIEVTTRSRDDSIKVIAEIDRGVTTVRESVQGSRHTQPCNARSLISVVRSPTLTPSGKSSSPLRAY